jgi:copper chaperone CopZ
VTVRWENLWVDESAQILTDEPVESQPDIRRMTVRTMGMICPLCGERIRRALERIEGVVSARVDREADRTEILYRGDSLGRAPDPGAPEDAAILRWARELLAAIGESVHAGDHQDACGVRSGPGVRQ